MPGAAAADRPGSVALEVELRQRVVEVVVDDDPALVDPDRSLRARLGLDRDEHGHRHAVPRDRDPLALPGPLDQAREVRLRVVDVERLGHRRR